MAELTKSNVKATVFGDMRIVMFEVDVSTGAGHAVTGLEYVFYANVANEDSAADRFHVLKNSNDGAVNSSNGSVYILSDSTSNLTVRVIAIGK